MPTCEPERRSADGLQVLTDGLHRDLTPLPAAQPAASGFSSW